jgi:hypothetical protein
MRRQNSLVMAQVPLKSVPQIIHFLEGRRSTPDFLTYEVGAPVQRAESIALYQKSWKAAAWMSHNRCIRCI